MIKIAIVPNIKKDEKLKITKELAGFLDGRAKLYMNKEYENSGISASFQDNIYDDADLIIVLGGDGTILRAASHAIKRDIPIMGVNLGRIGFMTEIEADKLESAINRLLEGDYSIEERMMMSVETIKKNGDSSIYCAMNDAVISKPNSQMIALDLYRKGEKVNAYLADGLVVATPTGSTGYSLSAGGPVADPTMEMFIATPICAHSLSSRATILTADNNIEVKFIKGGSNEAVVTIDGQDREKLECGESIFIRKYDKKVKLVRMEKKSFYDVLTSKLS